jgi:AmmeMemoRadiSam system protein B
MSGEIMSEEIRPSILAGNWYPGHPEKLKNMIQSFLKQAGSVPIRQKIYGLICPHAGYIYSGQTAAYAYNQMIGREFDTAVILSPMHHYGPGNYMINGDIAYETPLGNVPIDKDLLSRLMSYVPIEEMFFRSMPLKFSFRFCR